MLTNLAEPLLRHWITWHSLFVLSGLAIYVIASHTLHQRRHPSTAIAWVLSLVLLPYIALPLYLIFGSRKLANQRPEAGRNSLIPCASATDALNVRTQQLASVMALPPAASYHQFHLHDEGAQALLALRTMIDSATRSIDLCTFIFAHDRLGEDIAQCLRRRAKDGVRVRLLVDGIGAYLGGRTDFKSLSAAGIQVAIFVPPLHSSLRGRTNLRNHRKMLIADSDWLWCGGRNLAAEYFEGKTTSSSGSQPWLDLSFDVHGDLAVQAQQQFEQDWQFATAGSLPVPPPAVGSNIQPASASGQLIASGPDQKDDTFYTLLVSAFFACRKRILVVTPYFVPDPTLLMSLTLAARRGVSVDILMPKKSNHLLADLARHRSLRELTGAGARVWFLPQMIHAKAVIIDDEIAFTGSANLDARSLFLNYELMVAFYTATDVKRIARWIEDRQSAALLYRAHPPGLWKEIAEGLLLWLAFQL